jgi:hypothetical protein
LREYVAEIVPDRLEKEAAGEVPAAVRASH